jgi:hypothetical protein
MPATLSILLEGFWHCRSSVGNLLSPTYEVTTTLTFYAECYVFPLYILWHLFQ